ncbi:MAG: hypothetical protein E7653_05025 [Ruminococcaceae bacterium]|nr:hypothetical protein [Oscillospiraceae bacterium]
MANFICELEGVRGRNLKLYDTKIVITTKKTVGSFITGNITDGEKTIYLCDIVGIQLKKSGLLIGYLQFETPSLQMNNKNDNMFSENTFTYEEGKNGITNDLIIAIYKFVTDRIEELKYGVIIINDIPDFEAMKVYKSNKDDTPKEQSQNEEAPNENSTDEETSCEESFNEPEQEIAMPEGEQCEMCETYVDHLTYCKFKDDFGSRFRNICEDCIKKYNAKQINS